MATTARPQAEWTLADLHRRFGPMPASRIRMQPAPGTATVADVEAIRSREGRLCELIDGILVEKPMGYLESYLAGLLLRLIGNFAEARGLGIVAGEAGMMEIIPGMIRIPDVSFVSHDRLDQIHTPGKPAIPLAPDLAVEVLSLSNTKKEMDEKLDDYFAAGVRLVWYVDPEKHTVRVFSGRHESRLLKRDQVLDGGDVLPGFALELGRFFDIPPKLQALANAPKPR